MNAQHFSTDELADAADGLLEPERATAAESHTAQLREVSRTPYGRSPRPW